MFDIISGLDREKFVIFAAVPDEEPFYRKIGEAGARLLTIKKRSFSPVDFLRLVFFIRANSINIIHSHGKGAGLYSRLLKIVNPKIKIVHTFHGFHFDTLGTVPRFFYCALERALARLTNRFINVSESERAEYIGRGITNETNSVVIANEISKETYEKILKARQLIKFSANSNTGSIFLCNVSRFDEVKELPFLIEAFVKATASNDKLKLMLIGEGEEFEKCRELAAELKAKSKICFMGFRSDALEIMSRCDIYVAASRREGMPLSMIEAAAAGLPILASRVPGHVDIVSGYPGGLFFEYKDCASFKKALEEMLALYFSKSDYVRFAAAAHEDVAERYSRFYEELFVI